MRKKFIIDIAEIQQLAKLMNKILKDNMYE